MEFLKEHLGEELFNQVQEKLKDSDKVKLANLKEGGYISKEKYDALEIAKSGLETQVGEANTKIKEFEGMKIEDIKQAAGEWERKHKEDTDALNAQLEKAKLNSAIEVALLGAKAKDIKAAKALLNMDAVKLDGENLLGLSDQLTVLQADKDWLFGESVPPSGGANPPPAAPAEPKTAADRIAAKTSMLFK